MPTPRDDVSRCYVRRAGRESASGYRRAEVRFRVEPGDGVQTEHQHPTHPTTPCLDACIDEAAAELALLRLPAGDISLFLQLGGVRFIMGAPILPPELRAPSIDGSAEP